jgi:plasmid stability protein
MQLTLRVDDDLARRLKVAAAASHQSVNAYAGGVLRAAVDPDLATAEAERVRERLRQAGLLAVVEPRRRSRPDRAAVEGARRRAGSGRPLGDLVSEGRG